MYRIIDFISSLFGLILLSPLLLTVFIFGFFDTGSPLFIQERVGKDKKPFKLIKFRTMAIGTRSIASHLASKSSITRFGLLLRKTKIDELPQLWNVLVGDMSLVGPRPNLFNQNELIIEREKRKIYKVKPGITGLSQISKIDMSLPKLISETDELMIKEMTIINYFKFIFKTVSGSGMGDVIKGKE